MTYRIELDAEMGFIAIPTEEGHPAFLLPGNCLSEAQAFAERTGLEVVA